MTLTHKGLMAVTGLSQEHCQWGIYIAPCHVVFSPAFVGKVGGVSLRTLQQEKHQNTHTEAYAIFSKESRHADIFSSGSLK